MSETPTSALEAFARDVAEGLARRPREIPPRYFYDALGSQLFEAICRLPWYPITRAETALLQQYGAAMLPGGGVPIELVELGCGSGDKLATLVQAGVAAGGAPLGAVPLSAALPSAVHLIDVSHEALAMTRARLERLGLHAVRTYEAPYDEGLSQVAASRQGSAPLVVLFLGSNIGNFAPEDAQAFLTRLRGILRAGDSLLLGADLVKPAAILEMAYDDPLQVTAAFNRNLLRRINDELGGTFELAGFAHRALWNAAEQRVEMHLVSLRRQRVTISRGGVDTWFEAGETIWTESSYKYLPAQLLALGTRAGFGAATQWQDEGTGFALTRFLA